MTNRPTSHQTTDPLADRSPTDRPSTGPPRARRSQETIWTAYLRIRPEGASQQ